MHLHWNPADTAPLRAFHATQAAALQQHPAFGDALAELGTRIVRAHVCDDRGDTVAIAQFIVRRIGRVLGFALCSRGPVWAEHIDTTRRREGYRLLAREFPSPWPRAILFAPGSYTAPVGLVPVVTGESSVVIDLARPEQALRASLAAKWRNRLVAAERAGLTVHQIGVKPAQYAWLLDREGLQRERRGYQALPASFVSAWQASVAPGETALLTLRTDKGRESVAAMMFLVHGTSASYHLGWSDAVGRECSAHNLLLWRAMLALGKLGVRALDLGAINTQRGADLARFKIGSGGTVVRHPGTFW